MAQYPDIYVIRHGQTLWNREGRYQGRLDSALTAQGRAQANAMGRVLAADLSGSPAHTAYTSPLLRTRTTADLVLAFTGHTPTHDPRLQEVAFGDWEGLNWDDIAAKWPDRAAMAETEPFLWHFQAPGGEGLADITARAREFLDDLSGPAILVTHGVTSKVLRGVWLGMTEYDMAGLPGGQGVIFHLSHAHGARVLETGL